MALPLGDEAYNSMSAESERAALADAMRRPNNIFSIVETETERPIGRCLLFGSIR